MRSWGVEQKRLEFAEFYAAARDDCLRIGTSRRVMCAIAQMIRLPLC
jgi:hypothetical protein